MAKAVIVAGAKSQPLDVMDLRQQAAVESVRSPVSRCHRPGPRRRGVLLLVCLVLLVMFLMLGVTFVLTAGNFRRSSEAYQRMIERPDMAAAEQSGDLLDSVASDLVRGTTNADSPFSKENLLEDLYGRPALRGFVQSATAEGGGQLVDIVIDSDANFTPSKVVDYYSGLVLTVLTGNMEGQSTRVVGWDPSTNRLRVAAFPGGGLPFGHASDGDLFLVNGRPFSGIGTGGGTAISSSTDYNFRQLNEDYDAADEKNPWLAAAGTSPSPSWSDTRFEWGDLSGKQRPGGTSAVVDNDGDGAKDSIWIDVGLPLQVQPDGSHVKPLVAMLVRDLDGRVNLNAHGSVALQQALELGGSTQPLGQGYGPAEIDPFHALDIHADSGGNEFNMNEFLGRRLQDVGMSASGSTSGYAELVLTDPSDTTVPNNQNDQQDFSNYYHYGSEAAVVAPLDPHGQSYAEENPDGSIHLKTVNGVDLANDFSQTTYDLELDTTLGIPPSWHTPYAPHDLEGVLRFSDADADGLSSRLHQDLHACLNGEVTTDLDPDDLKTLRERITTESWDLPVPGLSLPHDLYDAIEDLIPPSLNDSNKSQLRQYLLQGGHISDLLKARILVENPDYNDAPLQDLVTNLEDDSFESGLANLRVGLEDFVRQLATQMHAGGFGVELARGTRFNVNRLFGNGIDDDGNGVVDDPAEAVSGETITAPHYNGIAFDHNGDGTPGQASDKLSRQHYAQQLYLLLMLLADGLETQGPVTGGTTEDKERMLARRLAQFAVNAVDYRDADSIMTGFEYDANPFDATGWDVDGDLATDESDQDTPEVPGSDLDRGVVWGCEDPVLYLTETYALHDRRVRDLNELLSDPAFSDLQNTTRTVNKEVTQGNLETFLNDRYPDGNLPPSGNLPADDITAFFDQQSQQGQQAQDIPPNVVFADNDFDQYAKPEGSLFIELHHASANPTVAASTYAQRKDLYAEDGSINLGKVNDQGSPVWRMAVSVPHPTGPDIASTAESELLAAGVGSPVFNQLVDINSDGVVSDDEAMLGSEGGFWSPSVTMQPGLPLLKDPYSGNGASSATDKTAKMKFTMQSNPAGDEDIQLDRLVYFAPGANMSDHLQGVRNAMRARTTSAGSQIDDDWDGIYCASVPASIGPDAFAVVGPRMFTPFGRAEDTDGDGQKEDTPTSSGIDLTPLGGNAIVCTAASDSEIPLSISEPLPGADYYTPNPQPDDTSSKYSMPKDTPADSNQEWMQRLTVKRSLQVPLAAPVSVTSRPEGEIRDLEVDSNKYSLLDGETPRLPFTTHFNPGTLEQYCTIFLQRLANPLEKWDPQTNPYISVDAMPVDLTVFNGDDDTPDPIDLETQQASSEMSLATALAANANETQDPQNTDPYTATDFLVSPVIKGSRQRGSANHLLFPVAGSLPTGSIAEDSNTLGIGNFGTVPTPAPFWPNRPLVSQYELLMVPASGPGKISTELGDHAGSVETSKFTDGFPHLLNFFFGVSATGNVPQLGRVFEYLHVPSKYTGTQTSLEPESLSGVFGFTPPFNVVSTYREPGRVNLNTVPSDKVWDAVMHAGLHQGPSYGELTDNVPYLGVGEVCDREEQSGQTYPHGTVLPLLTLSFEDSSSTNSDSNPFIRYQPINRMGNLVTNRSNVYAVWMTLGFFEVDDKGQATTTEAEGTDFHRHRAFYLIDRSIPVGYEQGQDHNTDDVFRVKRYIE